MKPRKGTETLNSRVLNFAVLKLSNINPRKGTNSYNLKFLFFAICNGRNLCQKMSRWQIIDKYKNDLCRLYFVRKDYGKNRKIREQVSE